MLPPYGILEISNHPENVLTYSLRTYLFAINVAKHLMERKSPGSIVFIGSMSGAIVNIPQPQAPYNAAKAAVRHLAASLAVEWAAAGIRVNCISPGYMLTAL